MKRINNLFEKICSIEDLELADTIARKGKSGQYGIKVLIDMIQKVPKESFPFIATIVRENECYEFQ